MNLIKITTMPEVNLFGFYDIKKYKIPAANQLVLTKYAINHQKIILNKEK